MSLSTLQKQPSESRVYIIPFLGLLVEGDEVTAITSVSSSPTGLTVGSSVINADGTSVGVRLSGGTAGTVYKITAVVTTLLSNTLEAEGYLKVLNT